MRAPLRSALALLVLAPLALGQTNKSGGELIPEQACYDVARYELALAIDPQAQSIEGTLAMRARALAPSKRIALDLDDRLAVSSITLDGEPAEYEREGGRIWIATGEPLAAEQPFEVVVAYGGKPRVAPRPPWDGGFTWEDGRTSAPWIATSCQGEGADLWWPCKDHPSDEPESMALSITVPDGLVVASNGVLTGTSEADGLRTFHWEVGVPINNYAVALNVAPYVVIEDEYESVTGERVPVRFYALPQNEEQARAALPEFLDHMRHLEEVCGPYPFRAEKYGIAETPHLGMEHQTIIAYGNRYRVGRDGYDWLHHHELSHEWWGNLVTCRDWKDMWIHEGIGTYMQALYIERKHGAEGYFAEMKDKRKGLRNQRPVAPRESHDSKQIYFAPDGGHDNDIYFKGACIVHTLRWALGDETFFRVLRRWAYPDPALEKTTDGSALRFSDTEELLAIAERVAERELDWFFETYLRRAELPALASELIGGKLELRWETETPFPMPVPVRIGDQIVRVDMSRGHASVPVPAGAPVELDPHGWLLRADD